MRKLLILIGIFVLVGCSALAISEFMDVTEFFGVSETKCIYVELNHLVKVGEGDEDEIVVKSVGRDDICIPNVIEKNIIYDSKGVVEIIIVTKEGTTTFKRTSPTENQPRFMTIGEVIEFDTCEECREFYK